MGMTMTQKILAAHCGRSVVHAGELIEAKVDMVMANDVTGPPAIQTLRAMGLEPFDKNKIALVPSHFAPNKDIKAANNARYMREFAREKEIKYYFEQGEEDFGIEHMILPENGMIFPGDVLIGADSHTCTDGALGAFATGVGSTDLGCAMATGETWFKVPEAMEFHLTGELQQPVSGKDLILYIIREIGVDGALYRSMEFTGPGVSTLQMSDRLTIANMAIEAGGKNAIFPVDQVLLDYLQERNPERFAAGEYSVYEPDEDAEYVSRYEINLADVPLMVAFPSLPSNGRELGTFDPVAIDQVVIGSCTNGRIEDLRVAADIFKGKHVAQGLRCIVIPGSQKVFRQALEEGLLHTFIYAGCVVSPPTCGPCLGGHMGVLADGEVCVSTTNRNFVGRMGHPGAKVYLASPVTAASSAVKGSIAGPADL